MVFVPLRVFILSRSIVEAFVVPCRILSQKKTVGYVALKFVPHWGNKMSKDPCPQSKILVPLGRFLSKFLTSSHILLIWVSLLG